MNTATLGFDFICTQPVAFYQNLCEHYLNTYPYLEIEDRQSAADSSTDLNSQFKPNSQPKLSINNSWLSNGHYRYRLQAHGNQPQLEQLAEQIAHDFLLSVHLIESKITPLASHDIKNNQHKPSHDKKSKQGLISGLFQSKSDNSQQASIITRSPIDYCAHCTPRFGDNQSPEFGQLDLACPHCHGETAYYREAVYHNEAENQTPLNFNELKSIAQTLLSGETASITYPILDQDTSTSRFQTLTLSLDLQALSPNTLPPSALSSEASPRAPQPKRPQVLVCDPNRINEFYHTTHEQVISLSCLEKPMIYLEAKPEHPDFALSSSYDVCFAFNRVLIVLTELLRQKGQAWVYFLVSHTQNNIQNNAQNECPMPMPRMSFIHQQWAWLQLPDPSTLSIANNAFASRPLHDNAQCHHYAAHWDQGHIDITHTSSTTNTASTAVNALNSNAAQLALYAALTTKGVKQHTDAAMIFLSNTQPSQIISSNSRQQNGQIVKDKPEVWLQFPALPQTGQAIIAALKASIKPSIEGNLLTQSTIIDKFAHQFPHAYQELQNLSLTNHQQGLTGLITIASYIIGVGHSKQAYPHNACDHFHHLAKQFQGEHSPRIDFTLIPIEQEVEQADESAVEQAEKQENTIRTFDWTQTIKSLMSFCLAEADNFINVAEKTNTDLNQEQMNQQHNMKLANLAFGFLDSLANDMVTWIEEADNKVGITKIFLAGEDISYEVLAHRLWLRLEKNYQVNLNWQLDLEGANLAVGGLYLPTRRR